MSTLVLSGAPVTETRFPSFGVTLTAAPGVSVLGKRVDLSYRPFGNEAWAVGGMVFLDAGGRGSHVLTSGLEDGHWEVRAESVDPSDPAQRLTSEVVSIVVDKAAEAPVMPPGWEHWLGETEGGRFGHLGCMVVGLSPPIGTDLGRILPLNIPKPPPTFSLSGAGAAGLTIHVETGMLEVIDPDEFLLPGTRYVTVTAANLAGEASTAIAFDVVKPTPNVWFVDGTSGSDANTGASPQEALGSIDHVIALRRSAPQNLGIVHLRRSGAYPSQGGIPIQSNTIWRSYGDPSDPAPHVVVAAPSGVHQDARHENFALEDLHISAPVRGFDGNNAANITLLRVVFSGNSPEAKNGSGVYAHGYHDFRMLHCTVADGMFGDGVYLRKLGRADRTSANKILYCTFGVPQGGSSDNLQITSERKEGMDCFDIVVSGCTFRHERASSSLKGNLVLEGCTGFLVERNDFSGRYFCASILSSEGTVRDNRFAYADLDKNSFALGSGGPGHTGAQRWLFNRIRASTWAMSISGYDDPPEGWQRFDYEVHLNTLEGNRGVMKIDRPTSGAVRFNLAAFNTDATIIRRADGREIARGGAYTNYYGEPNWFNPGAGPRPTAAPRFVGPITPGGAVRIEVPPLDGCDAKVIWLINDRPVSEPGVAELVIPQETSPNMWMPAFEARPTLGAAVIYSDAAGNRTVVPVRFNDGRVAGTIG